MTREELGSTLLASVSRSFYLSIRLLPSRLREPVGLAYLLARASDTIADTGSVPAAERLEHLSSFSRILHGDDRATLSRVHADIRPEHAGERTLIAELDQCIDWLNCLGTDDRAEIVRVMEKITRGQTLDLERFSDGASSEVTALPTAADLDEYTYLVAGSVGEFWTALSLMHVRRYSSLPREELMPLSVRFGQGLQLVNILRDLPEDLRAGRCYLPEDELRAAGVAPRSLPANASAARVVVERWLEEAAKRLEDGRRYIRALRPARIRAGCFVPWYLGIKTLQLLRKKPPLETNLRLKVSRRTVRIALFQSCVAAMTNIPLRAAALILQQPRR
jgi:farnesyl-diphosphate farnesyltransferase